MASTTGRSPIAGPVTRHPPTQFVVQREVVVAVDPLRERVDVDRAARGHLVGDDRRLALQLEDITPLDAAANRERGRDEHKR